MGAFSNALLFKGYFVFKIFLHYNQAQRLFFIFSRKFTLLHKKDRDLNALIPVFIFPVKVIILCQYYLKQCLHFLFWIHFVTTLFIHGVLKAVLVADAAGLRQASDATCATGIRHTMTVLSWSYGLLRGGLSGCIERGRWWRGRGLNDASSGTNWVIRPSLHHHLSSIP